MVGLGHGWRPDDHNGCEARLVVLQGGWKDQTAALRSAAIPSASTIKRTLSEPVPNRTGQAACEGRCPAPRSADTQGIVQTIGLRVALEYIMGLEMANIAAPENRLRDYARTRLRNC